MRIDVLTLFPAMLDGFLSESMLGRAQEAKLLEINVHNTRKWAVDKHKTTDDRPFGGGAGMVMKCEPIIDAIEQLQTPGCRRIYLTPDGTPFTSARAEELAKQQHLIFLSGHYEGIDQRIRDTVIDEEISIGDYVLTNGTLAAAVVIDALARFIPGVLGEEKSLTTEVSPATCSTFPITRVPPFTAACPCRKCSSRATTAKSRSGGTRSSWKRQRKSDPIYSRNSHEPDHQRNYRRSGEIRHDPLQSGRWCPCAHQGARGR